MYVVPAPLRPVRVFVNTDKRDQQFTAAFQQNSLQRVKAGDEAEAAFDAVPGRVFKGKCVSCSMRFLLASLPRRERSWTSAARTRVVTVVGKHCESGDVVVRDARVPDDIAVGAVLCTPVTGAYGHSMASNYNKVPRPAVVFVSGGQARVVVRREVNDDLVRLDE